MSRLLLLAVIFFVIYWLLKSYGKQLRKDKHPDNNSQPLEDMVRCVHCGVHIPKHESLLANDEYFCSEAHQRARTGKPDHS